MTYRTAAEVADELRIHPRTVARRAHHLGVGINIGGRWRFTDAEVQELVASWKPKAMPKRRRRVA